jgi:uncharacterized membrane protein YdcZ (DUF606 family)
VLAHASIASEFVGFAGGAAAVIAIGVFIGQAPPSLTGAEDRVVRRWATLGGIASLCFVLGVVVLSSALS